MSHSLRILGISGSLRGASYSSAVLNSLPMLLPAGSAFSLLDIGALPHYNQDLEDALPESVISARAQVAAADAVVLVTPEFNHGIPGVLKNTLDWLSRPAFESCFRDKPVLFITISPGALGGVRTQYQLRETLSSMLCRLIPLPEIAIPHVHEKLVDGKLQDEATAKYIRKIMDHFLTALSLA